MKANEFIDKFSKVECTPEIRETLQLVVSTLNSISDEKPSGDSIEVDRETFNGICAVTGITPTHAMLYDFIRIYDDMYNGVDIQTRR